MGTITRPAPSDLADLLGDLFDKPATVVDHDGAAIDHRVGVFVFDDGSPAYLCSGDLVAVAALGGALSMIPPGGVEAMVEDGAATQMAEENFYEVLNIASSLFNLAGSDHVRLTTMHAPDDLPEEVAALRDAPSWTLAATPAGYPTGLLTFRHA